MDPDVDKNAFYASKITLQNLSLKGCVSSLLTASDLGYIACFEGNIIFQLLDLGSFSSSHWNIYKAFWRVLVSGLPSSQENDFISFNWKYFVL